LSPDIIFSLFVVRFLYLFSLKFLNNTDAVCTLLLNSSLRWMWELRHWRISIYGQEIKSSEEGAVEDKQKKSLGIKITETDSHEDGRKHLKSQADGETRR
jgi:hypothetical protein